MKIAVTGGAGFIGERLARLLIEDGHDPVLIDLKKSRLFPEKSKLADITDREALAQAMEGAEAVYHLAAEHRDDVFPRERYYDVNERGTQNVIDAAKKLGIKRIIFTSSFALYGLNTGMPDENSEPQPFNDYGQSKLEAERLLKKWAREDETRVLTIIRPVVVFGEGNRGNVYTLMSQIARGRFVMIGSGRNRKSMAYVGNVAGFLKHCLNAAPGTQIYNYADKPDMSMQELTNLIHTCFGRANAGPRLPFILGLAAGYAFDGLAHFAKRRYPISSIRVRKFCADTTCAAERFKETGFKPQFTLEEGIMRMMENDFGDFLTNRKKRAA